MKFDYKKLMPDGFREFLKKEKNRKTVLMITVIAVLLTAIQLNMGLGQGKKLVLNGDGTVGGISRESSDDTASYPLSLVLDEESGSRTFNITITLSGNSVSSVEAEEEQAEDIQKRLVNELKSDIESSKGKVVLLPDRLSDGTPISWHRSRDRSGLIILVFIPVLVYLLYRNEDSKLKKIKESNRENILRGLPGFNDRLLMLLNCGLIFNDAFHRISRGYQRQRRGDYFRDIIIGIAEEAERSRRGIVKELGRQSEELGVKEMIRLSNVIEDNQYLGTDLREKLEAESDLLWNRRKQLADKKGKLAESKLTYPLVILLIVLILITAAPALLQVKGG